MPAAAMKPGRAFQHRVTLRNSQRGGIRRAVLVVTGCVALVAAAGLAGAVFGVPWLVERYLAQYEAQGPDRSASVGSVRFDPLRLQAELETLRLQDSRAQYSLAARTVTVVLSLRRLLGRRLGFESIVVDSPDIELGSLQSLTSVREQLRDRWLPAIAVGELTVSDGRLTVTADALGSALALNGISGGLSDFQWRSDDATAPGHLTLHATTASGVTIDVEGSVEAGLRRTTGQLALGGLDLAALRPILEDALRPTELGGKLDVQADYVLTAPLDTPVLEILEGEARVSDFVLAPAAGIAARATEVNATVNLVLTLATDGPPASGRVEIDDAELALSDARVTPEQTFEFANAAAVLSAESLRDGLSINLSGNLVGGGDAVLTARLPGSSTDERTLSFIGTALPARLLSNYSAQMLGHRLSAGSADVDLGYTSNGQRVTGDLRVVGRELEFVPDDDRSLDLAAALLANSDGVIDLDLPFAGSGGSVRSAAAFALRARMAALTATPFDAVAPLVDGNVEALRAVPFVPGDAALGDLAHAAIDRLSALLTARPRLGLRVQGGYDARADRNALARQQIQLHVLLATAGPSAQARPQPVDFGSERAQDVLDEFAGERLPAERVASIAAGFACDEAVADLCRRGYYAAVFDALVANAEITDGALNRLGRFRAQSVVEALTERGIDAARVEVTTGARVLESPFGIGLPVDLIVARL